VETLVDNKFEPTLFTGGIIKEPLEQWKLDLVKLIKKAYVEDKHLQSNYQQITFSPKGLAACLIEGRFIWGVINWTLIDPVDTPDYCDSYYDIILKKIEVNKK
jgi:hypothetical protein